MISRFPPPLFALFLPFAASAQEQPVPLPALPQAPAATTTELPSGRDLVTAHHIATSACEDPESEHMRGYEALTAELNATSILYAVPCTASEENVLYRLYAHETGEIGGIRTLHFALYSHSHGWTGADLLANIEVDGPKLRALFKFDPSGQCGAAGEWSWLAFDYRLDRLAVEETCRGRAPEDWPVIYPDTN